MDLLFGVGITEADLYTLEGSIGNKFSKEI